MALLNRSGAEKTNLSLLDRSRLSPNSQAQVRDLWAHKDLQAVSNGTFSAPVASHGVVMITLKPLRITALSSDALVAVRGVICNVAIVVHSSPPVAARDSLTRVRVVVQIAAAPV